MNTLTVENIKENTLHSKIFQILHLIFSLLKYVYFSYYKKDLYSSFAATLRYERLFASIDSFNPSSIIGKMNSSSIAFFKSEKCKNKLMDEYIKSLEATQFYEKFKRYGLENQIRLKYPRENDEKTRQGNLVLLKPFINDREKGVILLQYNDSFKWFPSVYDLYRVAKFYRVVLEPSTWGYRDPSILFFMNIGTQVIVQAQYLPDFKYIQSLHANLIALRLGAGDWIDPDLFYQNTASSEKLYDIVMVASWQRLKRHELLFQAMKKCGNKVRKVALIGYACEGRTKEDIVNEAKRYGVMKKIDIYEAISRNYVSKIIQQSKIGVMLTLREGANKGIYECFFSGVPVIISDRNIGVNRQHINPKTGLISSDDELNKNIIYLLENIHDYSPREWALKNTGYKNSTLMLNNCWKEHAIADGEEWTKDIYEKKNCTNAKYVFDSDRIKTEKAIMHLGSLLRN